MVSLVEEVEEPGVYLTKAVPCEECPATYDVEWGILTTYGGRLFTDLLQVSESRASESGTPRLQIRCSDD